NELGNVITGNSGRNALYGYDGNDRLNGGAGADYLIGGDGDDTYFVDDAGDRVYEPSATGGYDRVYSSVSFSLTYQYLERLELTGTANINATGNSQNNTLVGNSGANILDGGIGVDVMGGRGGDDTYIVDNVGDSVIESAGGGTDTVLSYVTFHLSRAYEIENLTLIGSSAVNAYGNHLDNRLEGNDNNNLLNGSTGADTMIGKGGTDTYYVDNVGDMVIEEAGGGVDTVRSFVSYTLGDHVENLVLEGSADIDAAGNALDNRISGNTGANRLDGGAGADVMTGGLCEEASLVENAGEMARELNPAE
ncbi:MAG: calcium-binding protein, partial [Allosphingosinicella sp.]